MQQRVARSITTLESFGEYARRGQSASVIDGAERQGRNVGDEEDDDE